MRSSGVQFSTTLREPQQPVSAIYETKLAIKWGKHQCSRYLITEIHKKKKLGTYVLSGGGAARQAGGGRWLSGDHTAHWFSRRCSRRPRINMSLVPFSRFRFRFRSVLLFKPRVWRCGSTERSINVCREGTTIFPVESGFTHEGKIMYKCTYVVKIEMIALWVTLDRSESHGNIFCWPHRTGPVCRHSYHIKLDPNPRRNGTKKWQEGLQII